MVGKRNIFIDIAVLFLVFAPLMFSLANTGIPQPETSLTACIRLFNSREFTKASEGFKKLLSANPDDEMLNYYSGACSVELNVFTDETIKYLLKAITGNTPDKVFYYTGRYYQSKEEWNSALKYYNRFRNFGLQSDKEEVQIEKLIGICYDKANQKPEEKTEPEIHTVETNNDIPTVVSTRDTLPVKKTEEVISAPDTIKTTINSPEEESFVPISFQVNSEIEYIKPDHFQNPEALASFKEGLSLQQKLDRILSESDSLRGIYSILDTGKVKVAERILALESESLDIKNQVDQYFNKARLVEQDFWSKASEVDKAKFREEVSTLKQQLKNKEKEPEPQMQLPLSNPDTISIIQVEPEEIRKEVAADSDKVVYKIQIGSFDRKIPESTARLYKKLSILRTIEHFKDNRGYTIYTTGNLSNFDDAVKMQGQVRQEGIKDAFIVAYKNGKRIPVNQARGITTKK